MIFEGPRADRRAVRKVRKFAASDDECGFPAPSELGYSCGKPLIRDNARSFRSSKRAKFTDPIDVDT